MSESIFLSKPLIKFADTLEQHLSNLWIQLRKKGLSNLLDIKMSTVSTYKKIIFEKLKVKTVVDLVRINDGLH